MRRLRWAMVGGGRGSLIGDSHRIAARIDARWELVEGAFDIDPERGRASLGQGRSRMIRYFRA
jgi:hypothetical protein